MSHSSVRNWGALLVALPLLLAGCLTAMSEEDLDRSLRASGSRVRGLTHPRVFPLHASSRMEALTLLADARTAPRERQSRDLAQQFSLGKTRRVHLIVGGPFSDLNRQILWNAFDYHEGKALPGLVVVFASPSAPDPELIALAKRKRVQLIHSPLE